MSGWLALGPAAVVLAGSVGCGRSPVAPAPPTGPTPPPPNSPPVIESISASVSRVEVDTPVTFRAIVTDAEAAAGQLLYEWEGSRGFFIGSGSTIGWQLPKGSPTPIDCSVTLTVSESYLALDASGAVVERQHRVAAVSPLVRVHDSPAELGALALAFMKAFSDSTVTAAEAVTEFADSCVGKIREFNDIQANRRDITILSSQYAVTSITIDPTFTNATVLVGCQFESRDKTSGLVHTAEGICTLTAVYERFRWWLCDSTFRGTVTPASASILQIFEGRVP